MKGEYLEMKNGSPNGRRPRGRPPGSKNKPKSPLLIADDDHAMSPYILEVPAGNDIVDAVSSFCRRKGIGLCVLTASGTVSNVTLRDPRGTVTFHGRFHILSLSATVLPAPPCPVPGGFTISLAGPQGQVVGGAVAGPLLAAATVHVIAATFNSPSYHRLPCEEEEESPPASEIGMYNNRHHQMGSDVMWARQPY